MQCSTACPKQERTGNSLRKWPGFGRRFGHDYPDAHAIVERYASLCDDLALDAFALAGHLEKLLTRSLLRHPEDILHELALLGSKPEESLLLPDLRFTPPQDHTPLRERLRADSLGLCTAALTAADKEEACSKLLTELLQEHGCTEEDLEEAVNRALRAETVPEADANESDTSPEEVQNAQSVRPALTLRYRLWLECEGEHVLGSGMIRLLSLVHELGSLKKAAERLNMPYRGAWGRIRKAEEAMGVSLLKSSRQRQKGVSLTPYALSLLETFTHIDTNFRNFLTQNREDLACRDITISLNRTD